MSKEKIVILSSLAQQFFLFEKVNISIFKELEWEVHGIANYENVNARINDVDIIHHHISIHRNPFSIRNLPALLKTIKYLKRNKITVVHCHSPVGGVIGRLSKLFIPSLKIVYTAHGFHFFNGQTWLKNHIFFFAEFILSKLTDRLVVINDEDFESASRLLCKRVWQVPGIGIDTSIYGKGLTKQDRNCIRSQLGVTASDFLMIAVGELIERKNHISIIRAISHLNNSSIKLIICGKGEDEQHLSSMIRNLNLGSQIKLLGYRTDIKDLMSSSDCFIFPSYQEGLPVSLMEAMATGLPVIASRIRGNVDLVKDGVNGLLVNPYSVDDLTIAISKIHEDQSLRLKFGSQNHSRVKAFDKEVVESKMLALYQGLRREND